MLRRGDDDGVDRLILKQAAMVRVDGRGWYAIPGVVQAFTVNIGEGGDFDVGASQRLVQQLAAALSSADQTDADAIIRAQHAT
jgi:hypothetical protein